jgi:hypothetical protein
MSVQLNNYTKALIPEPYTLLGIELKPFCLGHIFLMQRFGCAFSSESPDTMGGIDDLLLGISICSRTYEEFLEFVNTPKELKEWTKKWGKYIKKETKKKNFDILSKFEFFREYLKSGIFIPKYWELETSEHKEQSGTHWTHTVLNTLTSELGYTQSEALNVAIARGLQDYFRYLEKNGSITLMTDEDLEMLENSKANNPLEPIKETV